MPPPPPHQDIQEEVEEKSRKKLCATKSIDLYIIRYIYEELDR